jgi:hypothetical protein
MNEGYTTTGEMGNEDILCAKVERKNLGSEYHGYQDMRLWAWLGAGSSCYIKR